MVAPFCGSVFGGFLYDVFIYTGPESPINKPWWGFKDLVSPGYWRGKRERYRRKKEEGKYDV